MRQVERLRSLIRESINEYIKEIDGAAEKAANEARISACEEAIQKRKEKLSRVEENEDLKELASPEKVKEIQNEIKQLEKAKKKFEAKKAKMENKKNKKDDVVTDAKIEEAPVDEADVTEKMNMADEGMQEEALNESFLKMQKLAGVITENQYREKTTQLNESLPIGKSELGQKIANTLNVLISKMDRPDLESKARALAGQLISLADESQA